MNRLSLRVNTENPNHHLWLNNGTWFIHYVVHPTPITNARSAPTRSMKPAPAATRSSPSWR
jgi:hypothetical protein